MERVRFVSVSFSLTKKKKRKKKKEKRTLLPLYLQVYLTTKEAGHLVFINILTLNEITVHL